MTADVAVESVALALYERDYGVTDWNIVGGKVRARYLEEAATALEAAVPHMLAAQEAKAVALEEAADALTRQTPGNGPWGTPAFQHQAEWLRSRAAELRES